MDFLDTARIRVRSGSGGAGCVSFRREKNVPFGGPDGGNGGNGGDVWALAVSGMGTLARYRRRRNLAAGNGRSGAGRDRAGKRGDDCVLEVPAGTVFSDLRTGTEIGDLSEPGSRLLLARGGHGGAGNATFATATDRAPRRATPGEQGVERDIGLQLKLLADVGLVGLPNAGKSAFLSATSNARPKVADYPFTTLHPFLGVVERGHDAFVLADIPGLIEGAHSGAGLGDRFLGHIERCAVLLHLVDGTDPDIVQSYRTVEAELAAYGYGLIDKPRLVRISKADLLDEQQIDDCINKLRMVGVTGVGAVSGLAGLSGRGVGETLDALWYQIQGSGEGAP